MKGSLAMLLKNNVEKMSEWGIHLTQVTTICWGRAPQAPVISASKLGRQEPVLDRQSSTGVKGSQRDFRVQALTGRFLETSLRVVASSDLCKGIAVPAENLCPARSLAPAVPGMS